MVCWQGQVFPVRIRVWRLLLVSLGCRLSGVQGLKLTSRLQIWGLGFKDVGFGVSGFSLVCLLSGLLMSLLEYHNL